MSSYTTQDPSAYNNSNPGPALWSDQGAMATPYLFNGSSPSAASLTGTSSLMPSAMAQNSGTTTATSPSYSAMTMGLSAAAQPASSTGMAPSTSKLAVPAQNKTYTVSKGTPLATTASGGTVAGNVAQPLGYTVTPYNVPQYVGTDQAGKTTYYQWNPATNSYAPVNGVPANAPGFQWITGDINAYGQSQAASLASAQQQNAAAAATYAAQHPASTTPATTAQGSNFDFGSAFTQAPQAAAAVASGQSAQNSLASQLSTNNYQSGNIAAGGRYGAAEAVNTAGQNQLAIQTAQAADTDQNFAALGTAMQAASANATAETGAQANADISAIQDDVTALSSQLGTLNAQQSAAAQSQLTSLQAQINRYQQAVAQAGADSSLAKSIFQGILAAGAAVAVVATGGTAAVAGAAAAAASNA